jgi:hypothetical protein
VNLLGQIGLIPNPQNFVERGIEFVTRSKVHHVIVCISDTECIGAEPGGARIQSLTDWPNAIWSQYEFTPQQAQASADWARSKEGVPYNWIDDAYIGLACLFGRQAPRFIVERVGDEDTLQCAQLGYGALTKGAGIQVFSDARLEGAVFPGSFVPVWKQNGWM